MSTISKTLLISLVALLVCSCSAPQWRYDKNAISLTITGDSALNKYQKKAHATILCVYQLKDLNGFNQLIIEKDGLEKLLECSRFEPSATYAKRLVAQPGNKLVEIMDRTEEAKYLGVVAGYYNLKKEQAVRSYPIPISWMNNPIKLEVDLYLGPEGILERKEQK